MSDNLPPASFNEMEIAADNQTVLKICNLLNKHSMKPSFDFIVRYAFDEMKVFGYNGATLSHGHMIEFVDLLLEAIESRSYSIRVTLTDIARENIRFIKSKIESIDAEICDDFNNHFKDFCNKDSDTINAVDINSLIDKYLNEEETEMNDTNCDTVTKGHVCHCNHGDELAESELSSELIAQYEGQGDVFQAPVINFNAPIIYMGDIAETTVFEKVRDILLDFYNCNQ